MLGQYSTHPLGAPGSPQAVPNGCACPVLDNAHGAGIGDGAYWISEKCPIHHNAENTMPLPMVADDKESTR